MVATVSSPMTVLVVEVVPVLLVMDQVSAMPSREVNVTVVMVASSATT